MGYTGSADGAPPQPDGAEPARPGSRPVRRSLRNRAGAQPGGTALPPLESLYHAHYTSLVRLAALLTGDAILAESVAADSMAALLSGSFGSRPPEPHLFWLHRQVVVRSRRAARGRPTGTGAGGSGTNGSGTVGSGTVGSGGPESGTPESGPDGSGAGGTGAGGTGTGGTGTGTTAHAGTGTAGSGSDPAPNLAWRAAPVIGLLAALSASQREAVVLRHYLELSDDETAAVMGASLRSVRRSLGAAQLALAPVVPDDPRPDRGGPDHGGPGAAGVAGPSC